MATHHHGRGEATGNEEDIAGTIFHIKFDGSAFMFRSLRITSWSTFATACLITAVICLSERYLTYLISTKWMPFKKRNPIAVALLRSAMYGVATLERLIYMLIAMSFHAGLILATVIFLSIGQFFIELQEAKACPGAAGSYHPLRNSIDLDNESFAERPTSPFRFPRTPRDTQPEATQFQLRTPITTSPQPRSPFLAPSYRVPPFIATLSEPPRGSDIGGGNGRERAREIMGGEK
ncbi:Ctr domain containing protein [Ceratobasidium theobromae]|uniref:Ctr domain containing protein n=1 Tax=Ceratobasidium theobromae TaxID=1582974 RepID=A0A5N5QK65_9AGAM|nr:Ctr domain containing protein [Ceratobasidium theobromae]